MKQRKAHKLMQPLTLVVALISAAAFSANAINVTNGFHPHLLKTIDRGNPGIRVEDRADFSGKWTLNSDKSQLGNFGERVATRELVVEQTDESITIARTGISTSKETLSFDGRESRSKFGAATIRKSAKWSKDGQTLTITSATDLAGRPNYMKGIEAWTLSDDGDTLVLETTSSSERGQTTVKALYDLVKR